ncbi:MAG: hypothetical protein QOI45_2085 [Thermoleophilaceae bacterium]|jgi:hypothetical protein|nr:hypothetical protein [Thermoleophilaceae bacterium]
MADRFGAALGGLVLLTSAQLAASPPPSLVTAITLTLAVLAGGALGLARTGFEYAATSLDRALQADAPPREAASLRQADRAWPTEAELFYRLSVVLLLATVLAFLVGVWLAV